MNLYDTITQSSLNDVIDLLLNNYHREIDLNIDDSSNDYCTLEFDLSDGVDAGDEVIFNDGDNLSISISDKRLAEMGYTLRFFYYQLDKADYTGGKSYGDLHSFDVKLDTDTTVVPFEDNQVYLQKDFVLVLLKDVGYRLLLNASSSVVMLDEDVVLTADYTLGSVPVEDAEVSFYDGETLLGTGVTDSDGLAVFTVSAPIYNSHSFSAVCDGVYSNSVAVSGISSNITELSVNGSSFSTYPSVSSPFSYNGRVFVDWGDNTGLVEYTGGKLSHIFTDGSSNHTVKVYGDITSLEYNCFRYCTGLTSITLPDSITTLGEQCFSRCSGLTSITLSDGVTSLGENCFAYCTGLTSITLSDGVTSLGEYCFRDCTGLTSIRLNWSSSTNIITHRFSWTYQASASLKFSIPNGTTSLYTAKGYPSDKLIERT